MLVTLPIPDAGDAVRNNDIIKAAALTKRTAVILIALKVGDAVRNNDRLKAVALRKRTGPDSFYSVWNFN